MTSVDVDLNTLGAGVNDAHVCLNKLRPVIDELEQIVPKLQQSFTGDPGQTWADLQRRCNEAFAGSHGEGTRLSNAMDSAYQNYCALRKGLVDLFTPV